MIEASIGDIQDKAVEPARWFFEKTKMEGQFIPARFIEFWRRLIFAGVGHIYYRESGRKVVEAIGFVCSESQFNHITSATILFWFVGDERNNLAIGLMFNNLLGILEEMKIDRINFNALLEYRFEQVSSFLEGGGFVGKEILYQRKVNHV